MTVPFVDLRATATANAETMDLIARVLRRGKFILGDELEAFETEFAAYCGTEYCIGVNSGTDALHLALRACGIGTGDEVITVSHTFVATALAIVWTGATPVFVDIDPITYTMDVAQVAEAISARTRAIVPVHLYGQCVDMDPLRALAQDRRLKLIEDAAQAHGATFRGGRAGTLGDVACFSFYPTKNLGALGDGGAITTNDPEIAQALRQLRNYGQTRKYHHEIMGYNTRLDEIQAAVLRHKLPHLDCTNARRRQIAACYGAAISGPLNMPRTNPHCEHVYHLFVVRCPQRDRLQAHLDRWNVKTQIHYPVAVHLQPAMRGKARYAALPETERAAREVLSLPIYPEMTDEQVVHVCRAVNAFGEGSGARRSVPSGRLAGIAKLNSPGDEGRP